MGQISNTLSESEVDKVGLTTLTNRADALKWRARMRAVNVRWIQTHGSIGRTQIGLEKLPLTVSTQLDTILAPFGLNTARIIMPKPSADDPARSAQAERSFGMGWGDTHVLASGPEGMSYNVTL